MKCIFENNIFRQCSGAVFQANNELGECLRDKNSQQVEKAHYGSAYFLLSVCTHCLFTICSAHVCCSCVLVPFSMWQQLTVRFCSGQHEEKQPEVCPVFSAGDSQCVACGSLMLVSISVYKNGCLSFCASSQFHTSIITIWRDRTLRSTEFASAIDQ